MLHNLKKTKRQNLNIKTLQMVLELLVSTPPSSRQLRDHKLIANFKNRREGYLELDFLLIY